MTPLRQRMINDMTVRGLAENTKKSYLNSVTGLARHYRRSPDQISTQEVQDYLVHLHEQRGLSWKSCNCVRHGVRFLFRITLGVPDPHFYLPGAKTPVDLARDPQPRRFGAAVPDGLKSRRPPNAEPTKGRTLSRMRRGTCCSRV